MLPHKIIIMCSFAPRWTALSTAEAALLPWFPAHLTLLIPSVLLLPFWILRQLFSFPFLSPSSSLSQLRRALKHALAKLLVPLPKQKKMSTVSMVPAHLFSFHAWYSFRFEFESFSSFFSSCPSHILIPFACRQSPKERVFVAVVFSSLYPSHLAYLSKTFQKSHLNRLSFSSHSTFVSFISFLILYFKRYDFRSLIRTNNKGVAVQPPGGG